MMLALSAVIAVGGGYDAKASVNSLFVPMPRIIGAVLLTKNIFIDNPTPCEQNGVAVVDQANGLSIKTPHWGYALFLGMCRQRRYQI